MPHTAQEIHVEDTGQLFRCRLHGDVDASTASTRLIIFKLPPGVIVERPGTLETIDGQVSLSYRTGSHAGDNVFRDAPAGPIRIQCFLRWPDGTQGFSTIQDVDQHGNLLRIHPNV